MTQKTRLDHTLASLGDRERAHLELEAWKNLRRPDRALLRNLSREGLLNRRNRLRIFGNVTCQAPYLESLIARVPELELRVTALEALAAHQDTLAALRACFELLATEPLTQAEYDRRAAEMRSLVLPLDELVILLAESTPPLTGTGQESPDPEPWADLEDRLRRAIAAGEIDVVESEGRPCLCVGTACEYLGVPTPPARSQFGGGFNIRPDSDSDAVAEERKLLEQMVVLSQLLPDDLLRFPGHEDDDVDEVQHDEMLMIHAIPLKHSVQKVHSELMMVVRAVARVSRDHLFGEEPWSEAFAQDILAALNRIKELAHRLEGFVDVVELPEPSLEVVDLFRAVIEMSVPPAKTDSKSGNKKNRP